MANTTLPALLDTGTHAGRPAANSVGSGALYSCTDHSLVYQSDGSSWGTWLTAGSSISDITDLPTAETDTDLRLAPDGAGGVEWGTGGGAGSDVVNVASGAGSVEIPGLKGHPDQKPASPSAYDQEFDSALSGHSSYGTLDTADANATGYKSHLHLRKNSTGGTGMFGVYWAAPSTPFTVTCKRSAMISTANYQAAGLMLLEASPGKAMQWSPFYYSAYASRVNYGYVRWTNNTTTASAADLDVGGPGYVQSPIYLRIVATSSSSVAFAISRDGFLWDTLHTGLTTNLTIANVGLFVGSNTNSVAAEAVFDWMRFT